MDFRVFPVENKTNIMNLALLKYQGVQSQNKEHCCNETDG